MDENQFEEFILVPALKAIDLYTPSSHILGLGTMIVESNLKYVEQIGPGTAMGFGEVEEKTYNFILQYLNRYDKAILKEKCLCACFYTAFPPRMALMHNLRWAVIVTRLKYLPIQEALPEWNDAAGMARYHKQYYNTAKGKTDEAKSIRIFERIIEERKHRF